MVPPLTQAERAQIKAEHAQLAEHKRVIRQAFYDSEQGARARLTADERRLLAALSPLNQRMNYLQDLLHMRQTELDH